MKDMNAITKWHLFHAFHQAIERSIKGTPPMQEPDYIAMLINNLPSKLDRILNKYIQTLNFRVGGCFIHQKPLAQFCDPTLSRKSPEIGDLLIVYKETSRTKTSYYNALLLQAKKTNSIYHTAIQSTDKHQLLLYSQWPKFKYLRAGTLNGHIRSIKPKTITPGAQYLLIDEQKIYLSSCNSCRNISTFWCAKADNILVAANSLAHQLVDFINFQTGRPFVPRGKGIDHWSQMIWDLLTVSANSHFNRKNANLHKSSRFSGDIFNLLTAEKHNNHSFAYHEKQSISEIEGISVLAIEGEHKPDNQHDPQNYKE